MKEILQQVLRDLEQAYDNPDSVDLEESIRKLESAIEQYGDKGTMLRDALTALRQAKSSMAHLETAKDFAPESSFGQAHNALEQAIKSFEDPDNDPL